ncbi:MAG: chorismate mutase, partial [Planctomycetota bacterium]
MPDHALSGYRQRIDEIDHELVALLNERARLAEQIGATKRAEGASIFVPHREQQVFERIAAANNGPLSDRSLNAIWREIMSGSFALERGLSICHF